MDWSLFEYEISSGFDCTEQEQKAIAKLEKILGDRLFDFSGREIKARQYVGVFRLGDRTVEVLPKMYRSTDAATQKQEAVRNLLYMLEYTHQLSVKQYALASLSQQDRNYSGLNFPKVSKVLVKDRVRFRKWISN